VPFEHYIGQLCEEFRCLPSAAWREVQRLPVGFLLQIIEYRRYADAYAANAARMPDREHSELRMIATEIEHELAAEEIEARNGE
jgi:hypothetical protein